MTEWIDLQPRQHTKRPSIVTAALAVPQAGSAVLRFNITRTIGDALGWQPKQKVAVAHSKDGKRLRILRATGPGYTIGIRGTTLTFGFRLEWLNSRRDPVAAEIVTYSVEGQALIIDLPAWAAMPAPAAPAAPPAVKAKAPEPVAAPPPPPPPPPPKPAAQPVSKADVMARIGRIGRSPAPPPAEPAKPLTAPITPAEAADEAEREAKDLLRKGWAVRDVAARVGEDMAIVRDWKRQVDDERAAA